MSDRIIKRGTKYIKDVDYNGLLGRWFVTWGDRDNAMVLKEDAASLLVATLFDPDDSSTVLEEA